MARPASQGLSAQQFQLLVEALADHAIYMLDPQGSIVTWNAGGERIVGYATQDIVGQNYARFFTLEDQAKGLPANILQIAGTAGRYENECWLVRNNGSRFWAAMVVQPVRDERRELIGFAVLSHDVTERREAQRALYESERRFRLLVDAVHDNAIYMLDPSGNVVNWNAGAERLKGYKADEIVGEHFSRFYSPDDRLAGLPAKVLATAAREGRYEGEGWRVRKNGSRFWAATSLHAIRGEKGELVGYAKVTRDITERREAQEALRESERQFRLLVSGVTDYALFMLDPNGNVVNWNAGAQRIKGYAAHEIVGHHFSRFYTEKDRTAGLPAQLLATALAEGRCEAEGWRVRKDGSLFVAHVIIDAIRDETGQHIGFAKITRDISERKKAEAELQAAQVQRAHAQKMEAMGQLTGGVAHDFNNLLMIVGGHLNTLKKFVGEDAKGRRAVEAIELAAKRGETLTRQLLAFSRRQALKPAVVDMVRHIEVLRTMLSTSVGQGVTVEVALADGLWPAKVDASELDLAILNLFLNARDAMQRSGTITLRAENMHLPPGIGPDDIAGDFVVITVSDTGAGIPADILPKVFDPFFTTKPSEKGTGLGLSQVYGFAHQSGGTVAIESVLGKGTSVSIYLPRADNMPATDEAGEKEASAGGLVLLVEDNPEVAEATASMLEELRYEVSCVGSAADALAALKRKTFDLVISDIVMAGGMDGLALGREIRRHYPKQPVVLVSGYSDAANAAAHEFIFLRKPYQLTELSRAATNALAAMVRVPDDKLIDLRRVREQMEGKGPR